MTRIVIAGLLIAALSLPVAAVSSGKSTRQDYADYLDQVAKTVNETRSGSKLWDKLPAIQRKMKSYAQQVGYKNVPFFSTSHPTSGGPEGNFLVLETPEGKKSEVYLFSPKRLNIILTDTELKPIFATLEAWKKKILAEEPKPAE